MIREVVMEPFCSTNDALKFEAKTFGNAAAAGVPTRALDGDAVQFQRVERVRYKCPASSRHDAPALVGFIQPIAQHGRAIHPINIQMVDDTAEFPFMPDAGMKSPVLGELLQPTGDEAVQIRGGPYEINPRMPRSQVVPIGIHDPEQLPAVRMLDQPQIDLPINFVRKHGSTCPVKILKPSCFQVEDAADRLRCDAALGRGLKDIHAIICDLRMGERTMDTDSRQAVAGLPGGLNILRQSGKRLSRASQVGGSQSAAQGLQVLARLRARAKQTGRPCDLRGFLDILKKGCKRALRA